MLISLFKVLPRLTLVLAAAAVSMSSARPQFPDPLLDPLGARDEFHPATHLVVEVPAVPQLGFPDSDLGFFGEVYATPHHLPSGMAFGHLIP